MGSLVFALATFVGSHFLLSHPLRRPLILALGRQGFLGVYSLIALAALGWVIFAYSKAPTVYLWSPPAFFFPLTRALMLAALILLLGSIIQPNPSMVHPAARDGEAGHPALRAGPDAVRGVIAITRHPMMWGIGLWAITHALVNGDAATLTLCIGIAILALGGAALQDRRKAAEFGESWRRFAGQTAYMPFGAQLSGRLPWRSVWPGWLTVVGGVSLFVAIGFFHEALFGAPAFGG